MDLWFRLSVLFTIFAWVTVLVGVVAVYYTGLPSGSSVIVCAAPLALVSSVATFWEWRVRSAED